MPVTDVELVQRAGRGDADAVRQMLADVRPMVVRYCRARLGRVGGAFTTADDLAQEVCVAVLQALPGLRPSGRTFLAFVYRIAAHKVVDAGRAEPTKSIEDLCDGERQATGPERQGTGPDGRALRADPPDRLRHLLDRLSTTQREMVILRVAVGMSADDVGAALSMTPGAVRLMQHRALIKLRAMAGDVLDEGDAMNPDAAPSGGTPVDPMELREDAILLDALGRGEPPPPGDPLAAMLAAWRDDIRVDVADPPAAEVRRGKLGRSTRRRRVGVLSLAATALLAGGGVAAAHEARPGSVLWPVTEWTYPDLAASRSVQADLADAQRAAREGRTGDAHRLLDRAEQQVGRVDAPAEVERLRGRIEALRRSLPATVDGFPGRPPAGWTPGGHETPPASPTTSASTAPAKRGNAEPGGPDRPAGHEPGGPSRPDDRGPKPAKSHHRPR